MTTATFAIDDFLKSYAYKGCRDGGHSFPTPKGPQEWRPEGVGPQRIYTRPRVCPGCGMVRTDRMNARFQMMRPLYDRPKDYGCEPGQPFTREDVRRFEILEMLDAQEKSSTRRRRRKVASD